MDASYMLACGISWWKTLDSQAGMELAEALESSDPCLRSLARAFLVESGEGSMRLLERAMASGILSPGAAAPCIAEMLGSEHRSPAVKQHLVDLSLC